MQKNSKTQVYTQLANKYGVPYNVVAFICRHPFIFAVNKMADTDNMADIMFAYLFKMKLKSRVLNERKSRLQNEES